MNDTTQDKLDHEIPIEELSYEQAFKQLEELVIALESGDHHLDTAMELYERGQELTRHCSNLLDTAELKVKQLSGEDLLDFNHEAS